MKLEFIREISMRSFVKNPKNGGIPAIENKTIVMDATKNGFNFKVLNEFIVLNPILTNCCTVQNINNKEKL